MVTGVESFGLFVQGIELPAEGLVHVDSLADDYYHFDRATHTLSGHRSGNSFRLGDLLRVAVARVDLERRELDFRLVGGRSGRGTEGRPRPAGQGGTAADEGGRDGGEGAGHEEERPQRPRQARPGGYEADPTGPLTVRGKGHRAAFPRGNTRKRSRLRVGVAPRREGCQASPVVSGGPEKGLVW